MPHNKYSPTHGASQSPKEWYQSLAAEPGFVHDEAQARAVEALEVLWHELVSFKARRNQLLGRSLLSPKVPQGLYLWGGVGRGKTFLMDAFYACLPYKRKRRVHFHNFMAEVHRELKQLAHESDPLIALAENIAKSTRLLCFDEFQVSDVADAMILGRLFEALFARGVVLLLTSNHEPDKLYPHGLQRQKFLHTIALLKRELRVFNMGGDTDYRLREMSREPLFMVPADDASEARMAAMFERLGTNTRQPSATIEIQHRKIGVKRLANGVVWFEFDVLCGGPRDQTDYLQIAREFHTVFVSHIPVMGAEEAAAAQRFIWMVDVFYDNRVKLVTSAAAMPQGLCTNSMQAAEFARTASRLVEMQSKDYLSLPHQTESVHLSASE